MQNISVTELMNESGAIINDAVGLGDELTAIDEVPQYFPPRDPEPDTLHRKTKDKS